MNQYKNTQSLFPQLDQLFPLPAQANQFPLFGPSHPQSAHPVSKSFLDYLNQSKTANARNSSSFDALAEPTKKIKHSPQSVTKTSPISHSIQSLRQAPLPTDLGDLTMKDTLPALSPDETKQATPLSPFGEDLTIPGLNSLSQGIFQKLSHQAYERMLQQQLQQRKAQYYLQQQMMMQLTRQQMQYGGMNSRPLPAPYVDPQIIQLYQAMTNGSDAHKVKSENSEDMKTAETASIASKNSNVTAILNAKDKPNKEEIKSSKEPESTKAAEKIEPKQKDSFKRKTKGSKKNKKEQHWSQYKKILGNNIYRKTKEEPRNKNKWQQKDGGQSDNAVEQENPDVNINSLSTPKESPTIEKRAEEIPKKQSKPVDIPQHLQDESMIDYENLISITMTNDPMYAGAENPRANFITISKNTNPLCIQPRDTRVGDRYQVPVPEFAGKVSSKKRNPKTIWKPEIVKESELKAYFDELCRIFSCENINQEQALRLLKSKKYRKERVSVNIGKSRKYYAKVLMAPGENSEAINDGKP